MTDGVTIGQAAAFADITIKTVRHYHKLGLLDEPARDSSGYRRFGSPELLRLVQVRTLAAAGGPLADIGPLIDSDAAQFADALADAEQRLTTRITELTAQRDMLQRLTSGDRTLLPDRAVALLEGMPTLGFTPDDVQTARESFVLAKALVPEGFKDYLADIEHALRDPRFVELATDMAQHYLTNPAQLRIVTGLQAHTETATRYRLIAHHGEKHNSAAARLTSLVETELAAAGIDIPRPE